jgi:hypothetical protein
MEDGGGGCTGDYASPTDYKSMTSLITFGRIYTSERGQVELK